MSIFYGTVITCDDCETTYRRRTHPAGAELSAERAGWTFKPRDFHAGDYCRCPSCTKAAKALEPAKP